MKTDAIIFFVALVLSAVLTPLIARIARALGLVDKPGLRKVHSEPTPRLGGIAIAVSAFAALLPVLVLNNLVGEAMRGIEGRVVAMLLASAFVFGIGLLDDLIEVPSQLKLGALLLAAAACCGAGVRINSIGSIKLGMLAWPISMLWMAGIAVVVNFTDGLDGLAAGICAVACAAVAVMSLAACNLFVAVTAFALAGSLSGFLIYNFNPAQIFMGDGGSLFIGFLIGSASLLGASKDGRLADLAVPAAALAVPILDTALTFIRRGVLQRRSLFAPERGHLHHRLLDKGLAHRHVVLVLYCVTLFSAGIATLMYFSSEKVLLLYVLALVMAATLIGFFRAAGATRFRETLAAVWRNRERSRWEREASRGFEEMQLRFAAVRGFDEWWEQASAAAQLLGLSKLTLAVTNRSGTVSTLAWQKSDSPATDQPTDKPTGPAETNGGDGSALENSNGNGGPAHAGKDPAPADRLKALGILDDGPELDTSKFSMLSAIVPVRHRRIGPPLTARVDSIADSMETASFRVGLFARLMDEHSIADLNNDDVRDACNQNVAAARAGTRVPGMTGAGADPHAGEGANDGNHISNLPAQLLFGGGLKIAVVHDFLYCYAGAEHVLEQILAVFPHADVFSLFDFLGPNERGFLLNKPVRTSFIQNMPRARTRHRHYLPLMPLAIEQLDVSAYNLVISSSYVVAKGVITNPGQLHVCYCHTPVRFAWDLQNQYLAKSGWNWGVRSTLARMVLHYVRSWDARSSMGVDVFLTNSKFVGSRIEKYYRRTSTTIYPPVDVDRFTPSARKEDFYLTASRLVPYKRIDLIISAFNRMPDRRLIVVGQGPEFETLKALAGPNVRLVGHQSEQRLGQYMRLARAFVFAAEEDFGIVPVEAQASGTPVIAYGRGGVTESVIPGVTGVFFAEQKPESVIAAVREFESQEWDSDVIRRNAERFSASRFRHQLRAVVQREWEMFQGRRKPEAIEIIDAVAGQMESQTIPTATIAISGEGRE